MAAVTIHRCTVRVVRRGGWGWGADRRRLIESVARVLPRLLATHLASLWPDDSRLEIVAPLRLTLAITCAELDALATDAAGVDETFSDAPLLDRRVEAAVRDAVRRAVASDDQVGQSRHAAAIRLEALTADANEVRRDPVLTLLLRWHADGNLAARLSSLPEDQLEDWFEALLPAPANVGEAARPFTPQDLEQLAAGLQVRPATPTAPRESALLQRIVVAVAAAERWKLASCHRILRQDLERLFPIDVPPSAAAPASSLLPGGAPAAGPASAEVHSGASSDRSASGVGSTARPSIAPPGLVERPPEPPVVAPTRRATLGEVRHVCSALPFLILGPLARIGYLDAAAAVFRAAKLDAELPLLGAALAYKVLGPLARGWRRSAADQIAASTAGGLDEPVSDAALTELARRLTGRLAPADDELTEALTKNRSIEQPLLLDRAELGSAAGYLLCDVEGLFPLAWAASIDGFRPTTDRCKQSILLISAATAQPALLSALDAAGWRFVTDAPPGRGEPWRALRGPRSERYWTNDTHTPTARLLTQARPLVTAPQRAGDAWNALATERRAAPRALDPSFEISLTLTVAVALGDIAWTVWPGDAQPGPLLALERFSDLDARVRFDDRAVRVRVPLGRRHQDLLRHGLLADVRGIPWFGGRVLEFSGG